MIFESGQEGIPGARIGPRSMLRTKSGLVRSLAEETYSPNDAMALLMRWCFPAIMGDYDGVLEDPGGEQKACPFSAGIIVIFLRIKAEIDVAQKQLYKAKLLLHIIHHTASWA